MMAESLLFGFIAMVGLGMSTAFARKPAQVLSGPKTIFWRNIFTTAILGIALFILRDTVIFSAKYVMIGIIFSFFGYIPFLYFYKAIGIGKMGVVNPIANSAVIFTVIFSMILYGEKLSMAQLASISIISIGIFLISVNLKDLRNSDLFSISSGVPYAIITCVLWGVAYTIAKIPAAALGAVLGAFICEATTLVASAINLRLKGESLRLPKTEEKVIIRDIILVAIFASAGTLAYFAGVSKGSVSIVAALAFANPLLTYLYARFAWGERLTRIQHLAMLMILSGIVVISSV